MHRLFVLIVVLRADTRKYIKNKGSDDNCSAIAEYGINGTKRNWNSRKGIV